VSEPRGAERADAEHLPVSSHRIGELLLRNGAVEQHELEAALRQQEVGSRLPIGRLLIESGAIDENTLTTTLAQQFGLPIVDPGREPRDPAALARLSSEAALQLQALPICYAGGQLVVAIAEPPTPALRPMLEQCTGKRVVLALAPADTLAKAIEESYSQTTATKATTDVGEPETRDGGGEDSQTVSERCSPIVNGRMMEATVGSLDFIPVDIATVRNRASVPGAGHRGPEHTDPADTSTVGLDGSDDLEDDRIVTWLLSKASRLGAAAIELQTAHAGGLRIRFRVNGLFQTELHFSLGIGNMVVGRVLLAADLDPAMTSLQVGRLQLHSLAAAIGAEVTAVATDSGFTVLVRLEAAGEESPGLAEHVAPDTMAAIREVVRSTRGFVIVGASAGPDRRSLLRSLLAEADMQARSVVAIEDPGDDPISGVTRLLGDAKDALNAALALDPDIVLINRPRDPALIARSIDLALSDRLVFVAVDAADPASAFARVRGSADAFLVCAAVTLIVTTNAQFDRSKVRGTGSASDEAMFVQSPRPTTIETVIVSDPVRDAMLHDVQLGAVSDLSSFEQRRHHLD